LTGTKGGPLRRSGFSKLTRWVDVVRMMGVPGLHFHDLRHTGNTLAADQGVSLRNLMARMGHDNERAALIYQHASNRADRRVAEGLDTLLRLARPRREDDASDSGGKDTGSGANRSLIVRRLETGSGTIKAQVGIMSLPWAFFVGAGTRTTSLGIKWKPAVSATDLQLRQPASDPY
jgi:hypothetical protein